jgi:hypothetical protein
MRVIGTMRVIYCVKLESVYHPYNEAVRDAEAINLL